MTVELYSDQVVSLGVIADTHVPDRVNELHPLLIPRLSELKPDFILHAGDISCRRVLSALREVAPVYAVRGNRDILMGDAVPLEMKLVVNRVSILLMHGHLNPFVYWSDKFDRVFHGYQFNRFLNRIQKKKAGTQMCIFGHSHNAENQIIDGAHYFNPGSCTIGGVFSHEISYGVIKIHTGGFIEKEIVTLNSYSVKAGKWVMD